MHSEYNRAMTRLGTARLFFASIAYFTFTVTATEPPSIIGIYI